MKTSKIIIFILILAAFGAGVYFRDDAIRLYDNFSNQIKKINDSDIGSVINQVSKEILTPPPLFAYKNENAVTLLQSKIIAETNLQRQQNGDMPSLKENITLNKVAAAKANDILLNQYFEHISPSGIGPGDLAQKYGYEYIIVGENLILGNFSSEKEVVQDWMNSPGHRANILNDRYTEIGVAIIKGIYKGESVWIGVQEFGLPLSTCNQPSVSLKSTIDFDKKQLDILSLQIDERKSQIENTNKKSPAYQQMVDDYNQLVEQYNLLAEEVKMNIANYNNQVNIFNNCVAGN